MFNPIKRTLRVMDDRILSNIVNIVRSLKEEAITNSVGDGSGVAGLTGEPPVNLKKGKKRPTIMARGCFPGARKRWSNG